MNVSYKFPNGLYDSCKDVVSTSGKAILLMCGGVDQCTGPLLLENMGKKDPSPFQVDFNFFDETQAKELKSPPMNSTIVRCDEKWPKDGKTCSCTDCPVICKPHPQPPPPEPFKIFGVSGLFVIMFLVWIFLSSIFSFYYLKAKFEKDNLRKRYSGDDGE